MPFFILIAVFLISACVSAHAADTVVAAVPVSSDSEVWFGNALKVVLMACAAPVAAILSGMLWKLAAKFGVEASAADKANLEAEAKTALTVGAVKASDLIAANGWDHVTVNNAVLRDALQFFLERFPERATAIAAQAGVQSPAAPSAAKDAAITETLMARLPDAMNQAAASPATPPVTTTTTVEPGPPTTVTTTTEGAKP
jgi:hypothetical protein